EKFSNKTNGVTPRRWMVLSNPELTRLITERIGEDWVKHLDQLRRLEPLAEDHDFAAQWRSVKQENKERLAAYIRDRVGVTVDPHSLFSILVKRIHEYKRQHLCVLKIITLYQMLKDNPQLDMVPQTFIFGGKAAPGYYMAKLIIKLINSVADVINRDPAVRDRLHDLWRRWTDRADASGLTDLYGLQALALRAMVESGESFARLRTV
ncbi:MAG: glycogen/starch/alpha-glucan phosphorylase, partial [Anaerolineales bacterium]